MIDGAAASRARYLEGEFVLAVAVADGVAAAFAEGPAYSTNGAGWNAWADAQATKACALARLGRDVEADAVWRALAVVRPTWVPDKGFVPPRHVARHQALRDALLGGRTVAVTIAAGGRGEAVFDGRTVVPGSTVDVIPGSHWLGRAGDGRVVVIDAPVTLRADGGAVVAAPVEPAPAVVVAEDGPPWLAIGIGTALVVVAGGVVVGTVIALNQQGERASNPGGTTVSVDASALNPVVTP